MSSITEQVYRGSYDGFDIVFRDNTTSGGRKLALFEYPNQDTQSFQDLGLTPRSYELSLIVFGSSPSDYFAKRDQLLQILEAGGARTLVHPLYGRINNMVAQPYTLSEDVSTLGEGIISLTFSPDSDVGIPEASLETLSGVLAAAARANNAAAAALEEGLSVVDSVYGVASAAIETTNALIDTIKDSVSFVGETTAKFSSLNLQLDDISNEVNNLINNPTGLATNLLDVFETMWGVFESQDASFNAFESLTNFRSGEFNFSEGGPSIRAINNNDAQLEAFNGVNSVTGCIKSLVQSESQSLGSIKDYVARTEAIFQTVVLNEVLSPDVKNQLLDARSSLLNYLNTQQLTASQELQVNVQEQPARIHAFNFYNNSSRYAEIVANNPSKDISFVSGSIEILSE